MSYLTEYQKKLGLTPDGVMGKNTAAAMMEDLNISDKLFFAHLIGQMWHESAGFVYGRENLNYQADTLMKVWPSRFKTKDMALKYAKQPEKLANYVYAKRMGNGDEASGDGWKYRGIFGLQLTGKTNIVKFMKSIGLSELTDPETLLDDPRNYFLAGVFWFKDNGVAAMCTSKTDECIKAVSKRVNGGTHGLEDRMVKTKKMFAILGI